MALADEISRVIGTRIAQFGGATTEASMVSVGTVISVGDGIARIFGWKASSTWKSSSFRVPDSAPSPLT